MKVLLASLALAMAVNTAHSLAAGDAAAGQSKVALCLACHGADGNSINPEWPKLAGQHAAYTVKQLKNLQTDDGRSNVVMAPMIAGLSEQDMEDIAAYYETQAPTRRVRERGESRAGREDLSRREPRVGRRGVHGLPRPPGRGRSARRLPCPRRAARNLRGHPAAGVPLR